MTMTNLTRHNLETRCIAVLDNTSLFSPLEAREVVTVLTDDELNTLCNKPTKENIHAAYRTATINKTRFDSFNPLGKVALRKRLIKDVGYSAEDFRDIYYGMDKNDSWEFTAESGYDHKAAWEDIEALLPETCIYSDKLIYDMYTRFSKDALAWSYLGDNTLIFEEATKLIEYFVSLLNKSDISTMREELIEFYDVEGRFDYVEQVKEASDAEILETYKFWFTNN